MSDENLYEMHFVMDKEQLTAFYMTMAKALKNWPGGDVVEQDLLKLLRDESWKLLLEAQFTNDKN